MLLFPCIWNLFFQKDASADAILMGSAVGGVAADFIFFAPLSRPAALRLVLPIHKIPYRLVKALHRLYLHIFVAVIFVYLFC